MLWCGSTALADLKLYAEGFWGKKSPDVWQYHCFNLSTLHHTTRLRKPGVAGASSKRFAASVGEGVMTPAMDEGARSWVTWQRLPDFFVEGCWISLSWAYCGILSMEASCSYHHIARASKPVFWLWVLGPHMMTNWRKQHYISTWSLILHCINIILKLQYINTIYTYTQKCMVSCLGCTGWYKAMRSDLDETSEDELLDLLTCHRLATWISNSFPMCSSCGTRKFRIPKLFPYSWGFSWAICMGAAVSRCASEPEGWPWTPSAPHERWPQDFGGEACSWWIPRHTTWWVSTSWWVETSESITGCLWKNFHGPLYVLQVTKTRMYRWKGVGTLHYNHQSFPGEVFTDDV